MAFKKSLKSFFRKLKHDQGMGARRSMMEEMFNDLYKDRAKVYKMNFVRGLFFGFGSVLGATVVVALAIWILSFFVDLPGIGNAAEQAQSQLERGK